MKIRLLTLLAIAGAMLATPASADLPDKLELNYSLLYGNLTAGTSTRTLERQADGSYRHALHTTPKGMARIFTKVQWFEEGRFHIVKNQVRPLSFLQYRVGASKSHRHSAEFDWENQQIRYSNGNNMPLPPATQDQGSLLFALMLNPPTGTQIHSVNLSSGKKLAAYDYRYVRSEDVDTPAGRFKSIVVQWSPHAPSDDSERVTAWLASDKNHIPVKLVTQEGNKTATMLLQSQQGL
jgi:hypothetical protein